MQEINPTNLVVPSLKVKKNAIHEHFIVDIPLSASLSTLKIWDKQLSQSTLIVAIEALLTTTFTHIKQKINIRKMHIGRLWKISYIYFRA